VASEQQVLFYGGRAVGKNCVLLAHAPEPIVLVMVEGRGGKERCSFRTRTGAILYGGRAGWRLMGWVAVIACYWTSTTLLAHVPEPIVLHGGRAGWKRTVFFSHTYHTGANSFARWTGGVEKKSVLFAHVPEPKKLNYLKLYNAVLQGENWHTCLQKTSLSHKVQNPDPYKNADPGVRK
jgi:hypothetical protein